jgi:hypothetical protein
MFDVGNLFGQIVVHLAAELRDRTYADVTLAAEKNQYFG